tara:strand:- start:3521 stop:4813 length:1293 start_codon:yes stop_codon:yes gene_type:complete
MNDNKKHIKWFRDSSPYINAHRNKTFVLYLGGNALESANLPNIIADIALLNSLGVRLVLVHGAAPQIDQQLENRSKSTETQNHRRITPPELMKEITQIVGGVRANIEARLSMGLVNSPMHGSGITAVSGNFVKAKPVGIVDGIDFQNTGITRRVDARGICQQLDNGAIVLISPLGYSPSGETFNLDSTSLAVDVATSLNAGKLIYFSGEPGFRDGAGEICSELQADATSPAGMRPADEYLFSLTSQACNQGVDRCHIVSYVKDGALLEELFTRDGSGTQITRVSYEQIRRAEPEDVPGIIHLIEPLEQEGILVKRSRELIESEIEQFTVIERDGLIVCCGALYPFATKGELACVVTHPDYRDGDRGESLLSSIEAQAKLQGLTSLFVLTTQSAHWFVEHGFVGGNVSALPNSRKSFYNYQRNSKFFEKPL